MSYCSDEGIKPDDAATKVKYLVAELEVIQSQQVERLGRQLSLNGDGDHWLFEYIYNCDDPLSGFTDFLKEKGIKYKSLIQK